MADECRWPSAAGTIPPKSEAMRLFLVVLTWMVCALALVSPASAATQRSDWVVSGIRAHNRPFAAVAASGELDAKMKTMARSPLNFFRGTNHLFFHDMRTLPVSAYVTPATGRTWITGDAHLGNFDASRDNTGKTAFKLSDFDEGHRGQYVWDLRRLAASMVLSGRANGLSDDDIRKGVEAMVGAYADKMRVFADGDEELGFQLVAANTAGAVADTIAKAEARPPMAVLSKFTELNLGKRTFRTLPELVAVPQADYRGIADAMGAYVDSIPASLRHPAGFYAVKDIRRKLHSGLGSLGRLRYYVLIEGASAAVADDVVLEMKQQSVSAVVFATEPASSLDGGRSDGARTASTARAMLVRADALTGDATVSGVPYYVHENAAQQKDFSAKPLRTAQAFAAAAVYFGQALASAHAVSDRDRDPSIAYEGIMHEDIAGQVGDEDIDAQIAAAITSRSGLQTEIADFALAYAAQVQQDWQDFVLAYKHGTQLY